MSLIGLDIGTTGCKAIVFGEQGQILSRASREYAVDVPQPLWAEQDAERVWTLAWETLGEAVAGARGDPPLAIALSVQGEAVIPVDDRGRALRPAILGHAHRGRESLAGRTLWRRGAIPPHGHAPAYRQHPAQAPLAPAQ
jgi:xylulokinase